jgi:hypothetical protein
MTVHDATTTTLAAAPHRPGWLRRRLAGPGGLYNLGNAIGLAAGLALQVGAAGHDLTAADAARSVAAYLAGNGAALALTVATLVFFWSGEAYHRAWADPAAPDARLVRHGDILSGVGAALLAGGLFALGDPVLAVSSGVLHALGKFGSAVDFTRLGASGERAQELHTALRWTVVASRVPALLVALAGLVAIATVPAAPADAAPMLLTLFACYALWTLADLLLLRPARR